MITIATYAQFLVNEILSEHLVKVLEH